MSLHKLAQVTIAVYGLPEHCGTDEALQELAEEAKALLECLMSFPVLLNVFAKHFPELADKIHIETDGSYQ